MVNYTIVQLAVLFVLGHIAGSMIQLYESKTWISIHKQHIQRSSAIVKQTLGTIIMYTILFIAVNISCSSLTLFMYSLAVSLDVSDVVWQVIPSSSAFMMPYNFVQLMFFTSFESGLLWDIHHTCQKAHKDTFVCRTSTLSTTHST